MQIPLPIGDVRSLARRGQWWWAARQRQIGAQDALPEHANFVVISHPHQLSRTQVYAFYLHAGDIASRFGANLYELPTAAFQKWDSDVVCPQVRWLAFQTWFDMKIAEMDRHAARIRRTFPNASLIYLDCFAPLDLRFAKVLDPYIDWYVKKQFAANFDDYRLATRGDTNLTHFYSSRYGIDLPTTQFDVPPEFHRKLVVGTNFCVSPRMIDRFLGPFPDGPRPIDVHARIATRGSPWYARMREEARQSTLALHGLTIASEGTVSRRQFYAELLQSRICFSPFGYGEVCWRDYEALFSGALLVKPRMDHVRVAPDIFVADQTYVPIEWDGSDFGDRVREHLADENKRREMARAGFEVVRNYLLSGAAVDTLAPIFGHPTSARSTPPSSARFT